MAQPLIRWFKTKSQLCRDLEVEAIREYLAEEDREAKSLHRLASGDEVEKTEKEGKNEESYIIDFSSDKEVEEETEVVGSPRVTRMAAARAKAKEKAAAAATAGVAAAERSRRDGSSVARV